MTKHTEKEIFEWAAAKKRNLERQLVIFVDKLHEELKSLENQMNEKLRRLK